MSIFLLRRIKNKTTMDRSADWVNTITNYRQYPDFYNRRFYTADSPFKLDLRS